MSKRCDGPSVIRGWPAYWPPRVQQAGFGRGVVPRSSRDLGRDGLPRSSRAIVGHGQRECGRSGVVEALVAATQREALGRGHGRAAAQASPAGACGPTQPLGPRLPGTGRLLVIGQGIGLAGGGSDVRLGIDGRTHPGQPPLLFVVRTLPVHPAAVCRTQLDAAQRPDGHRWVVHRQPAPQVGFTNSVVAWAIVAPRPPGPSRLPTSVATWWAATDRRGPRRRWWTWGPEPGLHCLDRTGDPDDDPGCANGRGHRRWLPQRTARPIADRLTTSARARSSRPRGTHRAGPGRRGLRARTGTTAC